jgi:predicted enzyme related to lactoylglutathione lyase
MLERDGYIEGVPCWIDTSQPDPQAATEFYGGLFGWEFEDVMPADSPMRYFMARIRGGDVGAVGSQSGGQAAAAVWNTYVWVDDADQIAEKIRAAGGEVLMAPAAVGDAGRMGVFADPEGAAFSVWEAARHKGARIVNEPGSLNFNNLNTRDPEAARAFYGSVFGWTTLDWGGGSSAWLLPGYSDHLEELNPGFKKGMAEMGAPAGFEDAVATLNTITDDQAAHWSITFAVEDADQTAAKASELGGTVVVPPFDAPWVRMAVITDPQGAMFIASQFVPENKDLPADVTPQAAAA